MSDSYPAPAVQVLLVEYMLVASHYDSMAATVAAHAVASSTKEAGPDS